MLQTIKDFSKGPGILISTVMWEFFSIYGLRALLIFYLTQKLSFSDQSADQLFAAYISLIWVTPLIGGWLADKYLGFKNSVILGSLLIIAGHICISVAIPNALYIGLSLLICGIGFFKTNAICLVGSYYRNQPEKMPSMMTLYYVGANIGATLAPILCAYLQKECGYTAAFMAAAVGMAIGLWVLLLGRKRLAGIGEAPTPQAINVRLIVIIGALTIVAVFGFSYVLKYNMVSYVLVAALLMAVFNARGAIKTMRKETKRQLLKLFGLTLGATFFWVLDQQGGSSISLFISRNVALGGIPAAAFQSINPFMIIIVGVMVAVGLSWRKKTTKEANVPARVCLGVALLSCGFVVLSLCAVAAKQAGLAPMSGIVLSLALMGAAEIFIDPVMLARIGQTVPKATLGRFTAIYCLFVGAIANYISGKVAGLSALPNSVVASKNLIASARVYATTFTEIAWVGVGVTLLLVTLVLAILMLKKRAQLRGSRLDLTLSSLG